MLLFCFMFIIIDFIIIKIKISIFESLAFAKCFVCQKLMLDWNLLEDIIIDERRNMIVILEAWLMTLEIQGPHQLQADLLSQVDPEEGVS